tara:strand:+ start:115 stop:300 length:186 start_codon:yes stop_codon:yes gene_type:complete
MLEKSLKQSVKLRNNNQAKIKIAHILKLARLIASKPKLRIMAQLIMIVTKTLLFLFVLKLF